jgi:integrase
VEGATVPEDLRIHDLRQTCAALLIAQGDHLKAIQAHLGHSSIQVIELRSEREKSVSDQHDSEWGGQDSNLRPTDYETGGVEKSWRK